MGLEPARRNLFIVTGIAVLFAALMILFIILFATKKCDKCDCGTQYNNDNLNSAIAVVPGTRDVATLQKALESVGYTVFMISPTIPTGSLQTAIVTYSPKDSASTVMTKLNHTVTLFDSSVNGGIPACPQTVPPPTAGPTSPQGSPVTAVTSGGNSSPGPYPTNCPPPPTGAVCSSVVKDIVFVVDVLPAFDGTKNKTAVLQATLGKFGSELKFGDATIRASVVGVDSSNQLYGSLSMANNVNDFNTQLATVLAINPVNNGPSNIGVALAAVQQFQQFRNVDRMVVILSDHPPVNAGPIGTNLPTLSDLTDKLKAQGVFVSAVVPVQTTVTAVLLPYLNQIVSNPMLLDNNMHSFAAAGFTTDVVSFLERVVCGFVTNPIVPPPPSTTLPTTVKPSPTTPYTGPTSPKPTGSSSPLPSSTSLAPITSKGSTAWVPPSTPFVLPSSAAPPTDDNKCETVDLVFILDRSQSINSSFFNDKVQNFVRTVGSAFSMLNERKNAIGRIGVIEFADTADITMELKSRTRAEFLAEVSSNVVYANAGTTDIRAALQKALDVFTSGATQSENRVAILVTDGVSTADILAADAVAKQLRDKVHVFMGVGVPGINGNDISANSTNLIRLLGGKADYAYSNIQTAEAPVTGILGKVLDIYPCPKEACKGVIFVGEMTEVIGQERKLVFLNLVKMLAQKMAANPGDATLDQLRFSVALFGEDVLRHIKLQTYRDFNDTMNTLITQVTNQNLPNDGRTKDAAMMTELYNEITSGDLKNYIVLYMGEVEKILDNAQSLAAAANLAAQSASAPIYVLDMTMPPDLDDAVFRTMVGNDKTKILRYKEQSAEQLYDIYSNEFTSTFTSLSCIATPLQSCYNIFDISIIVQQAQDAGTMALLKEIGDYFNRGFASGPAYSQKSVISYGDTIKVWNQLSLNEAQVSYMINSINYSPTSSQTYDQAFDTAKRVVTKCGLTRTYAQNLLIFASAEYPVEGSVACTNVRNAVNAWKNENVVQEAYVYFATVGKKTANQIPCGIFDNVFDLSSMKDDPVMDNPRLNACIHNMCINSPTRVCPCTFQCGTNTEPNCTPRRFSSFIAQYAR